MHGETTEAAHNSAMNYITNGGDGDDDDGRIHFFISDVSTIGSTGNTEQGLNDRYFADGENQHGACDEHRRRAEESRGNDLLNTFHPPPSIPLPGGGGGQRASEMGDNNNYDEGGGWMRGALNLLRSSITSSASKGHEKSPTEEQDPLWGVSGAEDADAVHRINDDVYDSRRDARRRGYTVGASATRSKKFLLRRRSLDPNTTYAPTRPDPQSNQAMEQLLTQQQHAITSPDAADTAVSDVSGGEVSSVVWREAASVLTTASVDGLMGGRSSRSPGPTRLLPTTRSLGGAGWRGRNPHPPRRQQARFLPPPPTSSSSLCGQRCACPRCSVEATLREGGGGSTRVCWQQDDHRGGGGLAALQRRVTPGLGTRGSSSAKRFRLAQVVIGCGDGDDLRDDPVAGEVDKQKVIVQEELQHQQQQQQHQQQQQQQQHQQQQQQHQQQHQQQQQQPFGRDYDLVSSAGSSGDRCCYICLSSGPPSRHDPPDLEAGHNKANEQDSSNSSSSSSSSAPPSPCPCVCASLYVHPVCLRVWRQQTKDAECSVCHTPWTDTETLKKELEEGGGVANSSAEWWMSGVVPSSSYENGGGEEEDVGTPYPTWASYCGNSCWGLLACGVGIVVMYSLSYAQQE